MCHEMHLAPGYNKYRLLDGSSHILKDSDVVGFCHSELHKGYITVRLMKNHQCLQKKCSRFEKIESSPYWINSKHAAERKEKAKESKFKKNEKEKILKLRLVQMLDDAIEIAKLDYPEIIISNIIKNRESGGFIINYVSDNGYNDYFNYLGLAKDLKSIYCAPFELRKVKLFNGKYATRRDYNKLKI